MAITAELQPGGQSLVDPLAGRVEGRMGAEDGDVPGDQVEQHSPNGRIGGQPFRRGKGMG